MKKCLFKGAGVALITPMNKDGSINYEKLAEILDFQIENNTDAIFICATTGESAVMNHKEHVECISFAVKHVAGRIPVIAGAGSNDTAYAVEMSKEAKNLGADGLLHVTPYYNKASQRGLIKHFDTIANATDLPIILYNVPSRTGVNIAPQTLAVLAENEKIVAVKEASGNISHVAQTRALCGDKLAIYSGNDDQIVPILSLGGSGVISVLSNIMPQQTHDMCELFFNGDVCASAKLQIELIDLIDALFSDVNPIPVKEAMNIMGMNVGECRLPLCNMSDEGHNALAKILAKHSLIK